MPHILDLPPRAPKPDPKKNFFKGALHAFGLYATGMAAAGISYAVVGHSYIHGPGLHHLVIFLTFAGGFAWMLGAGLRYLSGSRTWQIKGVLSAHTVALVPFAITMYAMEQEEIPPVADVGKDEITMEHKGDTALLYHGDNIVYMKVKDSVRLNFLDSGFLKKVDSTRVRRR